MADDDKSIALQVAEIIQEAATHWDGDYQETADLDDALEYAEKIISLLAGLPFVCDRCHHRLDKPGALAFSDPLPHIDSQGWADIIILPEVPLAVRKHHICADCYAALAEADFMPTMTGYEIEEAIKAGHMIEMWFSGVGRPGWVMLNPDGAHSWVRAMLSAGHRGVSIVARVVGD